MKLRHYQESSSLNTRKLLAKHKRVILYQPTGGGKTKTATDIIIKAIAKGKKVCFLCDREELVTNTLKDLIKFNINIQTILSTTKGILHAECYIGMVESFFRRASKGLFDHIKIDLFIFDEAHMGNYFKVMDMFNANWCIGLTATPISSSKNKPLKDYYDEIVIGATFEQLLEEGFLCPLIEIGHNQILNIQVENGSFSEDSQINQFTKHHLDNKMIETWLNIASDRRTMVYNINIEHSKRVCELFKKHNISVEHVDSKTPMEERKRITSLYKNGFVQVICNVGIYTKGFDDPKTSCVVLNKSMESLSEYVQETGRGVRVNEGKENCILIDMGNNVLRHGSLMDNIDWEYIFYNDSRDKNFKINHKYKLCPVCFSYQKNQHINICLVCKNDFRINKMLTPEESAPELFEKDPKEMSWKELVEYAKLKGYSNKWPFMFRFKKGKDKYEKK